MVYTISWFKSQQGAGVILPETIGEVFLYLLTMLLLTFSYLTQLSQWLRWSLKHDHWSGSLIRPWCVGNWKPVDTNVKRELTPASTCCAEPHPWVPCQRLYSSLMEREFLSPLVPLQKIISLSLIIVSPLAPLHQSQSGAQEDGASLRSPETQRRVPVRWDCTAFYPWNVILGHLGNALVKIP